MKVNVLFFGILAEKTGNEKIEVESVTNLDGLKKYLTETFPNLDNQRFQVSVNRSIVNKNVALNDGDEVALMPPFAGG